MRARWSKTVVGGVAALMMAVGVVAVGPGSPLSPTAAGAADASLRLLRTVDVPLGTLTVPSGTSEYFSSPALADLDGDDRPELVVAAPNGTVTATRVDTGARLWQRALGRTAIQASPVVTDVDNDGAVDVVAATMDGRVVMLNGQNGGVKRTFRQGAPMHCPPGQDCRPDGFFATPVVADVNGDGRNDIVAASYDHTVYAWSWGGTLLWRAFLYDTLWSSPAVVDVDRNGTLEVVLGGDMYPGNPFGFAPGGALWVLNGRNGSRFSGYPKSLPGQTIWSSPAITDLDGDGRMEAVVGTGTYGPYGSGAAARKVHAITLATRAGVPGWPVTPPGRVISQPALGDIDNDGRPEVVVSSEGGYVSAYEHNGVRKWATCNAASTSACRENLPVHGGVAIADIDDDGAQEVVSSLSQRLRAYRGFDRSLEADIRLTGGNGTLGPTSVVAISEINGSTVLAQSYFANLDGRQGQPRAGNTVVRTDLFTTDQHLCAEDWPGFKRDATRSSIRPIRPPWHPFACGRPFAAQQYRDLLGRELDVPGQAFWTARLRTTWTGPRVIVGFMNSGEFGVVASPVIRVHLGLRGGPPIPGDQVRAQMLVLRRGGTLTSIVEDMIDEAPWSQQSDTQFVDGVFTRLMGSTPTSAQRQAALSRVAAVGRAQWVAEQSAGAWPVALLRGRVQVAMTYIGLLDRGPDSSGWAFWVDRVESGTPPQRLIELFLNSPEYRARVL